MSGRTNRGRSWRISIQPMYLVFAALWAAGFGWVTNHWELPIMPIPPEWLILAKITLLSMLLALHENQYRYLLQLEQGAELGRLPEWAEPDCFEDKEPRLRTGFRRVRARAAWWRKRPMSWSGGQYDDMITILGQILAIGCLAVLSLALDLTPVSWAGPSPQALPYYSQVTFLASLWMLSILLLDYLGIGLISDMNI